MKKYIISLLAFAGILNVAAQIQIPYQEYTYDVHYHWGMVKVNIGQGHLTMSLDGDQFKATLNGNTIPWEGRVYCVSDTLIATMSPHTPYSQENVNYINGWYMKPKESDYHNGMFDATNPLNYKNIKGAGELSASNQTMEAISITSNMLGLFYIFKEIDFDNFTAGQQITLPIIGEGSTNESVTITFLDKSSLRTESQEFHTFAATFEYTYNGSPSGYIVNTEIDRESRVPVKFSASLPIGHVEMIYNR